MKIRYLYFLIMILIIFAIAIIVNTFVTLLINNGIGSNKSLIMICLAGILILLYPLEAEVHEHFHRRGFINAGVSEEKVVIVRPSIRSIITINTKEMYWRTEVLEPILRDVYRHGLM
jgi:hypothetical protein